MAVLEAAAVSRSSRVVSREGDAPGKHPARTNTAVVKATIRKDATARILPGVPVRPAADLPPNKDASQHEQREREGCRAFGG